MKLHISFTTWQSELNHVSELPRIFHFFVHFTLTDEHAATYRRLHTLPYFNQDSRIWNLRETTPRSESAREERNHSASGFLPHQVREVHDVVFSTYSAKQNWTLLTRQNLTHLFSRTVVRDTVCRLLQMKMTVYSKSLYKLFESFFSSAHPPPPLLIF